MIERQLAVQGGLLPLKEEALPTNSASTAIFNNAPAGTIAITLTIYTGTLTVVFDGSVAPVAATKGTLFPGQGVYDLVMTQEKLLKAKGIGGATGWIVYWAIA